MGYNITDGLDISKSNKKRVSKAESRARKKRLIEVRKRVGLVFQYPEYQLFEETIEKDIAFWTL